MDVAARALAPASFGELGVQCRHGPLGRGRQQVPVYLVRDVDVPVPQEVC